MGSGILQGLRASGLSIGQGTLLRLCLSELESCSFVLRVICFAQPHLHEHPCVTYTQALTHTHGHIRNRTLTLTHAHTHTCVLGHNHVQSPVRSFVSLHLLSSVCTLKPMRSLMPVHSLVLMLSHLYTLKLMHTLTPLHQQPCTHSC